MPARTSKFNILVPAAVAVVALTALALWMGRGTGKPLSLRVPGTDQAPGSDSSGHGKAILAGKLITGTGKPSNRSGSWPQFRGPDHDGISKATTPLAHSWEATGLRQLWAVDVGDGYAGPVIHNGRVYLMDYDLANKQDA